MVGVLPSERLTFPSADPLGVPLVAAEEFVPSYLVPHRQKVRTEDPVSGGAVHFFLDDGRFEPVDPGAALARVGGTPRKCFHDIGELTLADQIEALAFAGVTDGCERQRYCPAQPVTRGQMATFLARTFNQPPTDTDFFVDDEASSHEQGINRLARANTARRCSTTGFCPDDPVTRAQMAAFIPRALALPAVGVDAFTDDVGDIHEAAINALASADITSGCDPGDPERFCPHDTVTRAQMAAFLMRVIEAR